MIIIVLQRYISDIDWTISSDLREAFNEWLFLWFGGMRVWDNGNQCDNESSL